MTADELAEFNAVIGDLFADYDEHEPTAAEVATAAAERDELDRAAIADGEDRRRAVPVVTVTTTTTTTTTTNATPAAVVNAGEPEWNYDDHRDDLPDPVHQKAVADAVERMVVQDEARRVFSALNLPPKPFDAGTLAEIVARGPEPAHRVAGLMPFESNLMIVATKKTGKTSVILNVARCLITGEKLFGTLDVRPMAADSKVAILNYEVAAKTLARWATEVGIPADRLVIVNLRGRRNPLKIESDRAQLAELLRGHHVEILIVDVFTKAFTGDDQSNNSQTQVFFDELERWAREDIGVTELVVTAHAGKTGDSFRGASQPEGWADVNVYLTRSSDSPTAQRHLSAEGRDVAMDKTPLNYDVPTRLFTLAATTGTNSASAVLLGRIERLLEAAAVPMNTTKIEDAMIPPNKRSEVRDALKLGEDSLRLAFTTGPRNAKLWTVVQPSNLGRQR
jgi:hypothetical protein